MIRLSFIFYFLFAVDHIVKVFVYVHISSKLYLENILFQISPFVHAKILFYAIQIPSSFMFLFAGDRHIVWFFECGSHLFKTPINFLTVWRSDLFPSRLNRYSHLLLNCAACFAVGNVQINPLSIGSILKPIIPFLTHQFQRSVLNFLVK